MSNGAATVPGWVKTWFWILGGALLVTVIALIILWVKAVSYKNDMYAWNKQMHRWAAHYYYCDSVHKDPAKCAQWSDHIPPPPPPPVY